MQKIILTASLALALASCGGGNNGTPGNGTGTALKSLSGKVYVPTTGTPPIKALPWSAGQKTVELEVISAYEPLTTKIISTGTVSSTGDLSINLPDTGIPSLPIKDYMPQPDNNTLPPGYSYECTGNLNPGNSQIKVLSGTLTSGDNIIVGLKDSVSLDNLFPEKKVTFSSLLYADGATSLAGSTTCRISDQGKTISTSKMTVNAQLKKGWNIFYLEYTTSNDATSAEVTMTTADSTPTRWLAAGTP